jgi:hypothetical protein
MNVEVVEGDKARRPPLQGHNAKTFFPVVSSAADQLQSVMINWVAAFMSLTTVAML